MLIYLFLLRFALLFIEACLAIPILYLLLLAILALLITRKRSLVLNKHGQQQVSLRTVSNFAILIPAHNEERMLCSLLTSLAALNYANNRFTIYVIADNCIDKTAALAKAAGWVQVYERFNRRERGKGYAIHWMLRVLEEAHLAYDAYVILDADSTVHPNFLLAMEQELRRGALAVHAHNKVANASTSPSTALRWLALMLIAHVRPLGRNALGGACAIGNGVCLSRALLLRCPWQAFSLTEDYQYYLTLVQQGIHIRYAADAIVYTHMPTTFARMRSQDIRWESTPGSVPVWRIAASLLLNGLRHRDSVRLEAFVELLTPPLSLLAWGCFGVIGTAIALRSLPELLFGLSLIATLGSYALTPLLMERPPRPLYTALLRIPGFMLWKAWVFLVLSRRQSQTRQWVRTSRAG